MVSEVRVARLRHLVVIIPGIGGSVLRVPGGDVVWGDVRAAGSAALWPKRLDRARFSELEPVGLLPGLSVIPPWGVPGYDGLVRHICNTFDAVRVDVAGCGTRRDLRADVLLFPYDFRLGVVPAARRLAGEIRARLGPVDAAGSVRRVLVVGHSMGGLVARYWLGPLEGAPYCRGLISVGTPHRGAPKALSWLMNGVRVGPLPFPRVTSVLRGWPGAYDLLPRYPVVRAETPGSGGRDRLYPHELIWPVSGAAVEAARAFGMHREIEEAWNALALADPRTVPEVAAVFARGHATLGRGVLSGGRLSVTKDDAEWLPNAGWRGDGTVPAGSAIPIELDDRRAMWHPVTQRHLPMASAPAVVELLRSFSGESLAPMRGDTPDRPWLGVDLEEAVPAGRPARIGVRLLGAGPDERTVVEARITAQHAAWSAKARGVRAAAGWSVTIPPLAQGAYDVTVTAANVPGIDQIRVGDVLGAVGAEAG